MNTLTLSNAIIIELELIQVDHPLDNLIVSY